MVSLPVPLFGPLGDDAQDARPEELDGRDVFEPLGEGDARSAQPSSGAPSAGSSGVRPGGGGLGGFGGSNRGRDGTGGARRGGGGGRSRSGGGGGGGFRPYRDEAILPDDAEEETGGEDVFRRAQVRDRSDLAAVGRNRPIATIAEAVEHVSNVIDAQVELGAERKAAANVTIAGDNAARNTFYTLLPDRQQREVFLRVAGSSRAWPRLRGIFGAPPYSFLKPEDAQMLRAAGIAHGRSNMAHDDVHSAAGYTQFGAGQLVDDSGREYRVMPPDAVAEDEPLPWRIAESGRRELVLQVRIKKRDRKVKAEMFKDTALRGSLTFPRPGERISLRETASILSIMRKRAAAPPATLLVRRVIPRGERASTAGLIATVG